MDRKSTPRPAAASSQNVADVTQNPEVVQAHQRGSGGINIAARPEPQISSIGPQQPLLRPSEGITLPPSQEDTFDVPPPPPPRARDGNGRAAARYQALASTTGLPMRTRSTSGLDWIVPVEEKSTKRRTVGQRLQPTIDNAESEMEIYARKALWTSYILNIAIGLQVFLGALTTGLAAAVTDARQAQVSTAILGGLSTLVASYLARARGSGEPELSTMRVKDLEHFLRDCRAFQIDHEHEYATLGDHLDHRVEDLRRKLEEMLGNVSDGGNKKVGLTQEAAPAAPTQSQSQSPPAP